MSLLIDVVNIIFATKSGHMTDKSKVKISLDKSYNRQILPSKQEENIDTIWKKRLHENPTLFNGTKFRLQSAQYNESDMNLYLNMGVTCYKDFLGTNWSPDALSLQSMGLEQHDDSQAYLSDALGVGALLRTADDKMIILKRSDQCGEDQGKWDRPGGHAEPKEVYGDIPMEMIELNPLSSEAVVEELFSSIIGEVVDEVNIPAQYLDEPKIIGLFRNTQNTGKPNMEFLVGSLDSFIRHGFMTSIGFAGSNFFLSKLLTEKWSLLQSSYLEATSHTIGNHKWHLKGAAWTLKRSLKCIVKESKKSPLNLPTSEQSQWKMYLQFNKMTQRLGNPLHQGPGVL